MSASDLERALAEARAAAARRLNALRQEGLQEGQQDAAGAATGGSARREPLFDDGGATRPQLRSSLEPRSEPRAPATEAVPEDHVVRLDLPETVLVAPQARATPAPRREPPIEVLHIAPVQAPLNPAPPPMAARGQAPVASRAGALEGALRTTIQPDPGPDYVPLDHVARSRLDAQQGLDAQHLEPRPAAADAPHRAGRMTGAVAATMAPETDWRARIKAALGEGLPKLGGAILAAGGVAATGAASAWRAWSDRVAGRRAIEEPAWHDGGEGAPLAPQRMTAKERRLARRRQRYIFEEILGWILVPAILVGSYFFVVWVFGLLGLTTETVIEGIMMIWSQIR